jgi:hypothetical protein
VRVSRWNLPRAPQRRAAALTIAIVAPLLIAAIPAPAGSTTSPAASGSITLDRCVDAAEKAQFARLHHHLVEAREELLACTRPECPAVILRDCTNWFATVDKALPTLVVSARDETGADLTSVRVTIDDAIVATALDGHAIAVDPGRHSLRVESAGRTPFAQSIVVVETEKDRRVEAILPRTDAPAPASSAHPSTSTIAPPPPRATSARSSERSSTIPLFLGTIGALSLVSWGYFGITSVNRYHTLHDTCGSACDPSDVHALEVRSAVADLSLGVGVVAIGAAVWIRVAGAPPSDATTPTISIAPTQGGAIGWVGGRF